MLCVIMRWKVRLRDCFHFHFLFQELNEWLKCIHEASNMAEEEAAKTKRMVHDNNISKELSDLVIYCQPIPFDYESKSLSHSCAPLIACVAGSPCSLAASVLRGLDFVVVACR